MTHPRHQQGFTVAACRDRHCNAAELPVLDDLGAAVRRCPHGMLVSCGCLLGPVMCRAWHHRGPPTPGAFVLVQACTVNRRPQGPAIPLGPLRNRRDLAAVSRWLESGQLHPDELPARLNDPLPYLRAAPLN